MKSKLIILNLILIVVNLVVTLFLLDFSTLEYASYSEYLLMSSYVGVFSLGLSATFQRKIVDYRGNYNKFNVLAMFLMLTIINVISFLFVYKLLDISFAYLLIVIVYNNYYLSKNLLSLTERFSESKIYEVAERIIFLFIIVTLRDINKIIIFDMALKVLFFLICYIRTSFVVNGNTIKFTKMDYINGLLLMLGNWLLIVALNMDKQVVLSIGKMEFGTYSIAISLFLLLNSLILPLRIYYFSHYNDDPTKTLNYVSIALVIVSIIGINVSLKINLFPEKQDSLLLLQNLLFLLPMYIQVNINLVNQMQIYKTINFAVINLLIVSISVLLMKEITYSISSLILYKFLILLCIYCLYMYSIKKSGIMKMLFITLFLFSVGKNIALSILIFVIAYIYLNRKKQV